MTSTENPTDLESTPTSPAPAPRRRLITGLAIGAGALILVAATAGITVAVTDDDDEDDVQRSAVTGPGAANGPASGDAGTAAGAGIAVETAVSDFLDARDAAEDAVPEGVVTEIAATRSGWAVDLDLATGEDVDVRIAADGTVTVDRDADGDRDDTAETRRLSDDDIESVHSAALAAAGSGSVVEIERASGAEAFAATVEQSDGTRIELDFAADLTVLDSDTDRPEGDED